MPSDLDIEILTIDDSAPAVKTVTKDPSMMKKLRTVRRSTGVGGKVAYRTIPFKPLRKSLPVKLNSPKKSRTVNPEYFDVEDDESDDDDIQVIENDPLFDVEVLDGPSEGFCDMCGLYLENTKDMENHYETAHSLVTCKWCQTRLATAEIKNHIRAKLCPNFTKLLGSHCSVHNEIETDDLLELEGFKDCRPLSCDACVQRYDIKSLREFDSKNKSFICPGCLHGRINASTDKSSEAAYLESIALALSNEGKKSSQSPSKPKQATLPVPQFLDLPNPVILPEILLLDDDEVDQLETESTKSGNKEVVKVSVSVEEPQNVKLTIKSPPKKRSNINLTSKLVEMINTEIQQKDSVFEVGINDNGKDVEEIDLANPEDEKNIVGLNSASEIEILDITNIRLVVEESSISKDPEVLDLFDVEDIDKSETKVVDISEKELDIPVNEFEKEFVDISENDKELDGISSSTNNEDNYSKAVNDAEAKKSASMLHKEDPSENVKIVVDSSSLNVDSSKESSTNTPSSPKSPAEQLAFSPLSKSAPVRRVARKSTKPPQNPQRYAENSAELLLFETNCVAQTPSPKRKLESPVSSVRKVARKSTRPPVNPQRTLFNEETTFKNLEVTEMDTSSLLLETPEKDGQNVMDELEVLDEIV